jgi:membrane protease YdiL (CAAX protease family)
MSENSVNSRYAPDKAAAEVGIFWPWFVYFAQIPFVIWYASGKVPVHPIVVMLPLVGLLNFKIEKHRQTWLGFRLAYPGRSLLLALIFVGLSLLGLLIALQLEGHPLGVSIPTLTLTRVQKLIVSFLISVFIIALWEEIINRGYMQTRLQTAWGMGGVIVTSLLFASMHIPSALLEYNNDIQVAFYRFVESGLAGFSFGFVYWMTGSVLIPIAMHGLNNFLISGVFPLISNVTAQELLIRQTEFRLLWLIFQVAIVVLLSHLFYKGKQSKVVGS